MWPPIQQGCFQKQLRLQQNRSLWFTCRLCSFNGLVCSGKQVSKTCIRSRAFCAAVSAPVFLRRHDLRLIKHALEISGEKHRHLGMFILFWWSTILSVGNMKADWVAPPAPCWLPTGISASSAMFSSSTSWCNLKEFTYQCKRCRRRRFHPRVGKVPGEGNGSPLQYSCLQTPVDRGAWRAAVPGVAKEADTT